MNTCYCIDWTYTDTRTLALLQIGEHHISCPNAREVSDEELISELLRQLLYMKGCVGDIARTCEVSRNEKETAKDLYRLLDENVKTS